MAAYGWRENTPVALGLAKEGHLFDFLQAVRLLEEIVHAGDGPERAATGEDIDTARDPVRFRSRVSLEFPTSEIQRIQGLGENRDEGKPLLMEVNFMGLAGALGPLPRVFSELILDRGSYRDTALRDFLDLFNHRLVSVMYRARKRYKPALDRNPAEGSVARTLFALLGVGTPGLRGRMRSDPLRALLPYLRPLLSRDRPLEDLGRTLSQLVDDETDLESAFALLPLDTPELHRRRRDGPLRALLPYLRPLRGRDRSTVGLGSVLSTFVEEAKALERHPLPDQALLPCVGLLVGGDRSMVGLAAMLSHYFGVEVQVEPFAGRWQALEEDQLTRIGPSGRFRRLGKDAALGRRVWDQAAAFRLRVGPLSLEQFEDFLPTGRAFRSLCSLTRFYVGEELSGTVHLTLAADEIPKLRVRRSGARALGWSTWLSGGIHSTWAELTEPPAELELELQLQVDDETAGIEPKSDLPAADAA